MNIIPIAFAFDNNLTMPAAVAFTSLLKNAAPETFYDIYILHSEKEELDKFFFSKFVEEFQNCKINYVTVGDTFDGAFEIRGITTPAYYRLLIPELIPEYNKVIYADADIIFRMDLSEVYSLDLKENYIAAVKDPGINLTNEGINYIKNLPAVKSGHYINSGFLIMNTSLMRQDNLVEKLKATALHKWRFQDQDTLNIVCSGRIYELATKYNMMDSSYKFGLKELDKWETLYSALAFKEGLKEGNIHYNGHKPWKRWSVNFDIWWEYYRMSPIYDESYYFNFFYSRLNELDQLSLLKRIKILVRYFIYPPKRQI